MSAVLNRYDFGASAWQIGSDAEQLRAQQSSTQDPTMTSMDRVPTWTMPVIARFRELLTLPENWDSYGASRPSQDAASAMFQVLFSVLSTDAPVPTIVPSSQGHFQVEWHQNGVDLEIEVVTPTKIFASYADAQTEWEDKFDFDFTRIMLAVQKLGTVA